MGGRQKRGEVSPQSLGRAVFGGEIVLDVGTVWHVVRRMQLIACYVTNSRGATQPCSVPGAGTVGVTGRSDAPRKGWAHWWEAQMVLAERPTSHQRMFFTLDWTAVCLSHFALRFVTEMFRTIAVIYWQDCAVMCMGETTWDLTSGWLWHDLFTFLWLYYGLHNHWKVNREGFVELAWCMQQWMKANWQQFFYP